MKKLCTVFLMLSCMLLLAACGKSNDATKDKSQLTQAPQATQAAVTTAPTAVPEKIDMNIAALKGPTAIGMVKLMEDAAAGTAANNYKFTVAGTPDEITANLVKGNFDIAAIPCNLASVLYNNSNGAVKLAGINTLGVLYIVDTGDSIQSIADLKGKTIYATGKNSTPQYTLNYILKANGIDPEKDVTIEYRTEPTEVASILEKSTDAVAMLPQPYVTTVLMKNDKLRIALNLAKEWDKVSTDGSSVVTGVVVVNTKFLESNQAAFDAFMKEYETSVEYVNNNVDAASALVEKYDIFKAAPIKKAMSDCNITLIQGDDMKQKVSGFLTALYNQNPKSVGGKLPNDNFYYMGK